MKCVLLLTTLLYAFNIYAQKTKDTLYFTNGSKITGEIKRVKLGVVTFDPDDANVITVQLQKVKTIAALYGIFRIETTEHLVYFGKMVPADKPGFITIISGLNTISLPVEQLSLVYPFKNYFKQRFSGSASAGFDFTRSSGSGRINYDSKLNYIAKKVEINFSVAGIYSLTDSTFSRDREDISIKNNYYFNTTWFGTLLFKYQRNLELGLQRRFQEGVGAGNKFLTNKHVYAWTRSGMVLNQEKNNEDEISGTLVEVFSQLEFNFFKFTKPEISFTITESFYYSLSQAGRFRNDAQANLSWEIIKDLKLTISAYYNYDTQPPSEESRKFDVGTVLTIGYTF
jgi:hypothetical protein